MMDKFTRHEGVAAVLLRSNVDTDAIIPSREMKRVPGVGWEGLFAGWRYLAAPVQKEPGLYSTRRLPGASIPLSGPTFGCAVHRAGTRGVGR